MQLAQGCGTFRGGQIVWQGILDEPVPTSSGYTVTAVGAELRIVGSHVYADNGTYVGMNAAALAAIDAGVKLTVISVGAATYCVSNTQGGFSYYKNGPAAAISATACT